MSSSRYTELRMIFTALNTRRTRSRLHKSLLIKMKTLYKHMRTRVAVLNTSLRLLTSVHFLAEPHFSLSGLLIFIRNPGKPRIRIIMGNVAQTMSCVHVVIVRTPSSQNVPFLHTHNSSMTDFSCIPMLVVT